MPAPLPPSSGLYIGGQYDQSNRIPFLSSSAGWGLFVTDYGFTYDPSTKVLSVPGPINNTSYIDIKEISAPSTPASGYGRLYVSTINSKIYFISDEGTTYDLAASGGGSGTPGGSNTQVQFNDGGVFGGDSGLVYDKTLDVLSLTNLIFDGPHNRIYASDTNGQIDIRANGTGAYAFGYNTGANGGNINYYGGTTSVVWGLSRIGVMVVRGDNSQITIDRTAASGIASLGLTTVDLSRWLLYLSDNETGSNVGANLYLARYDDAGGYIASAFNINRSTGSMTLSAPPLVSCSNAYFSIHGSNDLGTSTLNLYSHDWAKSSSLTLYDEWSLVRWETAGSVDLSVNLGATSYIYCDYADAYVAMPLSLVVGSSTAPRFEVDMNLGVGKVVHIGDNAYALNIGIESSGSVYLGMGVHWVGSPSSVWSAHTGNNAVVNHRTMRMIYDGRILWEYAAHAPDDDPLTMTQQMELSAAGYLGIGKTPSVMLDVNGPITAASTFSFTPGTITANTPAFDAAPTWNNSGVIFRGIEFNANVGGSGYSAGSTLIRLRRATVDRFVVEVDGAITMGASGTALTINSSSLYATSATSYFGNANTIGTTDAQVYINFRGASSSDKWQISKGADGDFYIACVTLTRNVMKWVAASGNQATMFSHLLIEGPSGYNASTETAILYLGTTTINLTALYNTGLTINLPTSHSLAMAINTATKWTLNSSGNVDMVGKVTTYENITTEGKGIAPIHAYVADGDSASIGWSNLNNTGVAGKYRISVYYCPNQVYGATCSVHVDIRWDGATKSKTGPTLVMSTTNVWESYVIEIYHSAGSSSSIQWQAIYYDDGNSDTYYVYVTAERLS